MRSKRLPGGRSTVRAPAIPVKPCSLWQPKPFYKGAPMNVNLFPFVVLWAIMAVAVIALIVIRKRIAAGEDDTLHVMEGDDAMIPHQQEIAQKLETIDRWGKSLTV